MNFLRYITEPRLSFYDYLYLGPFLWEMQVHHWKTAPFIFVLGVISSVALENHTQA